MYVDHCSNVSDHLEKDYDREFMFVCVFTKEGPMLYTST